jgi:hypothetical protein
MLVGMPVAAASQGHSTGTSHLETIGSYQANIIGKYSRERTQDVHRWLDDFHQFFVTFPKLSKDLGLLLKQAKDVTGRPP